MKRVPSEYHGYAELLQHHTEGHDFDVEYVDRRSPLLVMAPHGGKIEPYTDVIAATIAGDDLSLYAFKGKLPRNNRVLHLTSHLFDEPRALAATMSADTVLAVHGAAGQEAWTMVGGLDTHLLAEIVSNLTNACFHVRPCPQRLSASMARNICNRGSSGAGVQLEISEAQRENLTGDAKALRDFSEAIRGAFRFGTTQ